MEVIINIRKRKGPLKFDMKKLAMVYPTLTNTLHSIKLKSRNKKSLYVNLTTMGV